jgi:hypothetical protein
MVAKISYSRERETTIAAVVATDTASAYADCDNGAALQCTRGSRRGCARAARRAVGARGLWEQTLPLLGVGAQS